MLYGVAVPSVDRPMDWKETTALNQPFAGPTAYATNPQYWLNVQTGIVVSTSMKLFGHCVINIPSMDVKHSIYEPVTADWNRADYKGNHHW